MASTEGFVQFVSEQIRGAGMITYRKMFGDYCLYCNGKVFALVCDDRLYIKVTEAGKCLIASPVLEPPYEGARPYFYIEDVENWDFLSLLVAETCKQLPEPKSQKYKKKQNSLF